VLLCVCGSAKKEIIQAFLFQFGLHIIVLLRPQVTPTPLVVHCSRPPRTATTVLAHCAGFSDLSTHCVQVWGFLTPFNKINLLCSFALAAGYGYLLMGDKRKISSGFATSDR
jgi:hypothetical protein